MGAFPRGVERIVPGGGWGSGELIPRCGTFRCRLQERLDSLTVFNTREEMNALRSKITCPHVFKALAAVEALALLPGFSTDSDPLGSRRKLNPSSSLPPTSPAASGKCIYSLPKPRKLKHACTTTSVYWGYPCLLETAVTATQGGRRLSRVATPLSQLRSTEVASVLPFSAVFPK